MKNKIIGGTFILFAFMGLFFLVGFEKGFEIAFKVFGCVIFFGGLIYLGTYFLAKD